MMRLWKNQTFVPIIKQDAHDSTLDLCLWMYNNLSSMEQTQRATHEDHAYFRNIETGEGLEYPFIYQSQQTSQSLSLSPRCQQNTKARHRLKWAPPPVGELRLDVDVYVINEQYYSGRLGIGGIVRDSCGSPILAFGRKIDFSESVIKCELRAIKEGLEVCHEAGFFPTIVFSGSLLAVQAIINEESRSCVVDVWLVEIKRLLQVVNGTHLEFANRSSNYVAYSIAKFVCFSLTNFVWVAGDFPYWLEELVNGDIST
ncbi:hypothetical protein CASFOL_017078 [Castilleja foliolosa]|uniref:RNase H type-1 domain-containing protein n=1 Tax=Castilleja foliolosa TaxID=1961234 RepID=A0ABD3DA21_9LAMI